jgi:hypothetical protein
MALTLENGRFVATYKTAAGKDTVRNEELVHPGQTYTVGFLRTGKQVRILC